MFKIIKPLILSPLLLLACCNLASAASIDDDKAESTTDITPEERGSIELGLVIGTSELSVNKAYTISGENYSTDSFSVGIEFAYRWPENYLIETSFTTTIDTDIFGISDNYQLYQWNTLVGYSFPITERIRLIPKVGFSRWELDTREGALFNPGPELSVEFNDTDFTYQLGLEFPVWEDLNLGVTYENTRYSFGKIEIVNLGFSFEF